MADPRWADLEARGLAFLREPRTCPRAPEVGNRQFMFQFWSHPSFDSWTSWTVYSPWHGVTTTGLVRRVIWDHAKDAAALIHPATPGRRRGAVPTLYVADAALDWSVVQEWQGKLPDLRVTIPQKYPVGADGEASGIRFGDAFVAAEFRWWGAGPADWKPLRRFAEDARDHCESLFG